MALPFGVAARTAEPAFAHTELKLAVSVPALAAHKPGVIFNV